MQQLHNYVLGQWMPGDGDGIPQYHALTGEIISTAGSEGLDYARILEYGRTTGGSVLRRMTFQERGRMLKALALYLMERKELYYQVSHQTGATRADSWVDIEGGIGNLFAYSSLRRRFPNEPYYVEGETVRLSKENTFIGHHILVPKKGVAVHINAFNFPIWGMLEKVAVNLLAGMPAVVKPSEQTSYLTEAMFRDIIASGILPEGALQLVVGAGRGIIDHVQSQDIGARLDAEGIAVRVGHHCALPALRSLGFEAVVRPSLSLYNTREEIDQLVDALQRIAAGRGATPTPN